ncbi:CPBP family intramembrane glutamic endopeptidase [Mammaliicoccus sciuri]|uniref:CPBP family intramembrane glutamic endopeptidase n=1 Tax=Mammaliicoccus sciuri TaxID=1296 RepID=UPI001C4F3DC6|nr:type II CAAX endopeptidase family protein [Mammaliicoccus sciuri]
MLKREKYALAAVIVYIFIMCIGMIVLGFSKFSYDEPEMVKVIVYFEIVLSIYVMWVYKQLKLHIFLKKFKFTKWLLPYLLIFMLMIVFTIFTGNLSEHFPLILLVGLTTLLVGFSEELMFRGIFLTVMLEKRKVVFALIASSVAFSLLHLVNIFAGVSHTGALVQLLLTFLFGLIFSCLAILIKNIVPLIIYHFIWDFILITQSLTGANIQWISYLAIGIELIIVIPLFIYTTRFIQKKL